MTATSSTQSTASTSQSSLSEILRELRSTIVWYKATPDAEKHEFPMSQLQEWYQMQAILISARFSFDKGATWESIIDLRRRNGPCFPFLPKMNNNEEETTPGCGSIVAARRMVEATRAEVERLEQTRDEMEREVAEQEKMLQKMLDMEKELTRLKLPNREKYAQVEGRMFQVTAKLERESKSTEKKPKHDDIVLQADYDPVSKESTPTQAEQNEDRAVERVEAQSGTDPEPEPETSNPSPSPSRILVARPAIFPMLEPTTMPNDYTASDGIFLMLRNQLDIRPSAAALDATVNTFNPPPTCSLCAGAQPLPNLVAFLYHVLSKEHRQQIAATGGKISVAQCFFWLEILQKGYTSRPPI